MRTLLMLAALLGGCAPLFEGQRAAPSTLGCAQAAMHERLPPRLPDKLAHCHASALIAARCSVGEARLLGLLKELGDLFGPGRAETADLRADQAGIRCARSAQDDAAIAACCAATERLSAP